jgi:hypothetical protein
MSVFRVSALALAAALALSPAGIGQAAAARAEPFKATAQAEPPVRLVPPKERPSEPAPVEVEEAPLRPPRETLEYRGYRRAPAVEVDRLQAIDPDSIGALDESEGGFGIDMWGGTRRSVVETLLPALPARADSPAMRELMRRLLLSIATVPAGPASEPSLIARRVERLAAMGEVGAVVELLEIAPADLADETLWKARIDGLLLTNDHSGACTHVRNLIREYQGPYWQKAFIFCQTMAGEHSEARLGTDLLREQITDEDGAFFTLVDALMGVETATVDSLSTPTALHLAMMRTARQKLPPDAARAKHPAVLGTIAVSPNAEPEMRLEAAEGAEAAGALSAEALAEIYASVSFAPDELANVLSVAEADRGPRGRAALYQAARMQTVPTARAEVLQTAWRAARASGRYGTAVRAGLPLLLEIEPTSELVWFAADAGRALFYAGKREEAFAWLDLFSREARSPEGEAAFLELWPLAQLADGEDLIPWEPGVVGAWLKAEEQQSDDWQDRAATLLSLFDALGEPVDSVDWERLLGNQSQGYVAMPTPAVWHGLGAAAENLRLGETVLLALVALGEGGPAEAHPIVLNAVVSSLRFVGLDSEARALAVEAAVAAGI